MTSFFPTGQRQFKLDFKKINEQGIANLSGRKWELQRDWIQGVKVEDLKNVSDGGIEKSIYKLVLNNVWTQKGKVNFEDQEVKNAFGLVKATWKGSSGWEVTEEKVNEENKVWLIMAKGKDNVYLMPVLRTSGLRCGEWGDIGERLIEGAKSQIKAKGVEEIKTWTKDFDKNEKWDSIQNSRLKDLMSDGFSITRGEESAVLKWEGKYSKEKIVVVRKVNGEKRENWETKVKKNGVGVGYLHKNAGELSLKEWEREKSLYCSRKENFFPLDLVVLGDITVMGNTKEAGKITIYDEISQVIGASY